MKTLTEISGSVIRTAAAAIAQARRSLPRDEKAAEAPVAAPAPQPPEGAAAGAPGEAAPAAVPAPPAPPAVAPTPEQEAESEAVKAALDEAVAKATGYSGDRLAMLRAAVHAAGRRAEDVRLVRVFGLEEQLKGASVIGEHQYVLDFFPPTMKQVAGGKDERDRGGRRGGGRGGGGGGARGAKGSTSGGFSMDSLREDRRNERGGRGRPGGGRRPGGGGGAGGGPSGAPPGGDPKK